MGFGRINLTGWHGVHPVVKQAWLWAVLACVFFAGCTLSAITRPDEYTVRRGDTLYSVAQRYDLSWREVARWNNISPPYTLSPGQVLSLDRYPPVSYSPPSATQSSPKVAPKPAPSSQSVKARKPAQVKSAPPPAPKIIQDKSKQWRWPNDGPVLRSYEQTQPRHGIDIGGKLGDGIVAAEAGRVVYSGAGLKGYGKLLIIKHDERFLTAYGFNRKVFVAQGDSVKAGQKIAEMGVGPRNENMLHFELRQDGQPVDPQRLLPRR